MLDRWGDGYRYHVDDRFDFKFWCAKAWHSKPRSVSDGAKINHAKAVSHDVASDDAK